MTALGLARRHLDRKTPWRLVKKYCEAAGIDPTRLGARGIGIHSLRKTAINDAIRNGTTMHEVREFPDFGRCWKYRRLFTSICGSSTWSLHALASWPIRPLRKGIITAIAPQPD